MGQQPSSYASQEHILRDYVVRLGRFRDDRRAIHFHLSRLKPQNRREHHIRIAVNTLEDFTQTYDGRIFRLGNGDIVVIVQGVTLSLMDDAVMRLRVLFSEDPLTMVDGETEGGHGRFATLYNIEAQYEKFLELCEHLMEEERKRRLRLEQMAEQAGENMEDLRKPLTPQQLGRLEEFLARTDLTNVMRRQPVCAFQNGEEEPRPIFNELFISIVDLATTVLPDVNLSANRWLFQHLTQTLDRRVLRMLSRADDSSLHSSFSINLNVSTLLAPEFLDFDSSLRMGSRGTLVVELQIIDILADYQSYVFARDFARERGYRICIDGVTPEILRMVDRKYLGADLIKLSAGSAFDDGAPADQKKAIAEEVERVGKGRVILARCDSEVMIYTGQDMGITMFQGRYLDMVLQQIARAKPLSVQRKPRAEGSTGDFYPVDMRSFET